MNSGKDNGKRKKLFFKPGDRYKNLLEMGVAYKGLPFVTIAEAKNPTMRRIV